VLIGYSVYEKVSKVFRSSFFGLLISSINPLNAELHPICHLLALLGDRLIFHVSRIRVKEQCGSGKDFRGASDTSATAEM